jgi:hypothetical protein
VNVHNTHSLRCSKAFTAKSRPSHSPKDMSSPTSRIHKAVLIVSQNSYHNSHRSVLIAHENLLKITGAQSRGSPPLQFAPQKICLRGTKRDSMIRSQLLHHLPPPPMHEGEINPGAFKPLRQFENKIREAIYGDQRLRMVQFINHLCMWILLDVLREKSIKAGHF